MADAPVLGRVGVWGFWTVGTDAGAIRDAVAEVEEQGWPSLWLPEIPTTEAFANASLLLAASRRLVVATGIANIYARDPAAMAAGGRILAAAYPGRFLLGIGVSHAPAVAARGHDYGRPVATMRSYLDAMERPPYPGSELGEAAPLALAALGPRMLELAAERTLGAHPYFVPVEHTAFARETMGAGPLLLVEAMVVLERDASRAREVARQTMRRYLALDNYRNNLKRLGWADDDLDGPSDRLVDAIVAWGGPDEIRARVREHLDAGADHVCIQPLPGVEPPVAELGELAPALLDL